MADTRPDGVARLAVAYDAIKMAYENTVEAANEVLAAYQVFLDTDDLDVLRDALTGLQEALGGEGDDRG